jgi:hypothetical protein
MLVPDFWSVWNVILYQPFQFGAGSAEAIGAHTIAPAVSTVASAVLCPVRTVIGQRLHTPLTILLHTAPGGVGLIVGENDGPDPLTAFSVGVPAGASEVAGACEVDGVLVAGASFSLVLHAVRVPIPMMAAPPARRAI